MGVVVAVWSLTASVEREWRLSVTLLVAFFPPVWRTAACLVPHGTPCATPTRTWQQDARRRFKGMNPRQGTNRSVGQRKPRGDPHCGDSSPRGLFSLFLHSARLPLPEYRKRARVSWKKGGPWVLPSGLGGNRRTPPGPLVPGAAFLLRTLPGFGDSVLSPPIMFRRAEVSGRGGIKSRTRLLRAERGNRQRCSTSVSRGRPILAGRFGILTFWKPPRRRRMWTGGAPCTVVEKAPLRGLDVDPSFGGKGFPGDLARSGASETAP
ncbi:MAG: hypothetical protein CM15mP18_2230 [Methanobacteriota archaeon]|nr:MAG: hypothetical protein CM15mP18_2230 [Euryarchaeota archaeon]